MFSRRTKNNIKNFGRKQNDSSGAMGVPRGVLLKNTMGGSRGSSGGLVEPPFDSIFHFQNFPFDNFYTVYTMYTLINSRSPYSYILYNSKILTRSFY